MKAIPTRLAAVLAGLALALALAATARADGLIVVRQPTAVPTGHFPFAPLEVTYHRVAVTISDSVATTTVDQEFYNPSGQRLEGTYLFPLPAGAHIDKFSMDINGKMAEAELLPADKAKAVYEDIVRSMRDPALLEYSGRDAFKARIFPIDPAARKHIRLTYTQVLKPDAGLTEYLYSLNTEKYSAKPLKDVSIKVDLSSSRPIKNVYCPSHNVEIHRDGERHAVIGYEEHDARPDTDFKLVYTQEAEAVGLSLLTYRNPPDDGYFLLMASPGDSTLESSAVQPRDIAFVLDTSGSMAGPKMDQAKKALLFCLANLNPSDRFEIVRFSTEAEGLFRKLEPADAVHIEQARNFVNGLKPIGGTAIGEALAKAKELATGRGASEASRPYVTIFLTDGQPTIGETNEDKLVAGIAPDTTSAGSAASAGNSFPGRIFSFGIGSDVNTHLLDRLANNTRALSQYVLDKEDIEVKVSTFYTRIAQPVLSDVKLDFTGTPRVSQMYPASLPDLYRGQTLLVFGRYSGPGPAAVTLSGSLEGRKISFAQDLNFTEKETTRDFIPRLWATRRAGFLLDEIRMHGESKELVDEVTRLARDQGIVTPYTAYLIVEDEAKRNVPLAARTLRELDADTMARDRAKAYFDSAAGGQARLEKAGTRAVENSALAQQLKFGSNVQEAQAGLALQKAPMSASASTGYRVAQNYAQQARVINGRAFYQNGTVWTEAKVQSLQSQKNPAKSQAVKFNSPEYFALLKAHPDLAPYLALGTEVDVVVGETIYNVRG